MNEEKYLCSKERLLGYMQIASRDCSDLPATTECQYSLPIYGVPGTGVSIDVSRNTPREAGRHAAKLL
jgi:hypothetical protein